MMNKGRNSPLHVAKRAKNDEFYTRLQDIEAEVDHYVKGSGRNKHNPFEGKVVYLNCDDPFESNFFKYFAMKFKPLGLRGLIATTYEGSYLTGKGPVLKGIAGLRPALEAGQEVRAYGVELTDVRDLTGDGEVGWDDIEQMLRIDPSVVFPLEGDGDFRSDECVELLKRSDVVVTNPPFSLFREYVAQLIEHEKQFLIIGNMNAITYKETFPLIKDGKVWLGMRPVGKEMFFGLTEEYQVEVQATRREGSAWKIVNGEVMGRIAMACWFTNLDNRKRHEELDLVRYYEGNEDEYPRYDNYDAIEVSKVKDIPADYEGVMGVPITFLDKHNPEQFEIVRFRHGDDGRDVRYGDKTPYFRILVRNHNPQK